jgi:hypothetical protein
VGCTSAVNIDHFIASQSKVRLLSPVYFRWCNSFAKSGSTVHNKGPDGTCDFGLCVCQN